VKVIFEHKAELDIAYWQKRNLKVYLKLTTLIKNTQETPYLGLGKPEALKYGLSGYWSRRVNKEHRLIYTVLEEEQIVIIHSCKGHYK
jgi:toxin YoeB